MRPPPLSFACLATACIFAFAALAAHAAEPIDTPDVLARPATEVERRLPASHPAQYFIYAGRRWRENHADDAVFWLYVAQLRYRFHLAAHPSADPSGDPALLASLMATIGPPINRHAGGDIPAWRRQIARALKWDRDTPNDFTSKREFPDAWKSTRDGLEKLSAHLEQNAPALMKQREESLRREAELRANPPTVRPPVPPVSVAPDIKMPADWPALAPVTTGPLLAGSYTGGMSSPFVRAFFADHEGRAIRATSFEIAAPDEQHLHVRAMRDERILNERIVDVRAVDGALLFIETAIDFEAGRRLGPVTRRQFLRRNAEGDLVIERHVVLDQPADSAVPKYIFWTRATRADATPSAPNPAVR